MNFSPAPGQGSPLTVRRLTAEDCPQVSDLCRHSPYRYLAPRLNLEAFGYEEQTVPSWGVFAANGSLCGLVTRFGNTLMAADGTGLCASAAAELADSLAGLAGIRGTAELIRNMRQRLRAYRASGTEASTLMRLAEPPRLPAQTVSLSRRAAASDLDALADFYSNAWSMHRSRENVAAKIETGRVFIVEVTPPGSNHAKIASCALLNVEGASEGLIGGVYTAPEYRGRGYAAACTAALSRDLQSAGKTPCLFFENPVAGRVYMRLGFTPVGSWSLLYVQRT